MELTISLPYGDERLGVTGAAERNLKMLREALGVNLAARDGLLRISGEGQAVGRAAQILERLSHAAKARRPLSREQLLAAIAEVSQAGLPRARDDAHAGPPEALESADSAEALRQPGATGRGPRAIPPRGEAVGPGHAARGGGGELEVYLRGRQVKALTGGQRRYLDAIAGHDLTFCIGPAGTGKTFLAVAAAAAMLRRGEVRKLVLVRPAVEAGEKLGFLPGDMQAKVNPYLRPLLDALHDMMDFEQIQRFMATDVIEIVPLAFMRGRTLNDALIILDEAQNASKAQMLMFLTRLGHGSKMVVTGDTSQIDLEDPRESGLVDAARRLMRVPGIAFVTLEQGDIVRHSLVQRIVEAYGPRPQGVATTPVARRPRSPRGETPDAEAAEE